jgi:hypothetical protein
MKSTACSVEKGKNGKEEDLGFKILRFLLCISEHLMTIGSSPVQGRAPIAVSLIDTSAGIDGTANVPLQHVLVLFALDNLHLFLRLTIITRQRPPHATSQIFSSNKQSKYQSTKETIQYNQTESDNDKKQAGTNLPRK